MTGPMSELMVSIVVTVLVMLTMVFGTAALFIHRLLRRAPRITGTLAAICVLMAINAPRLRAERYSERAHARIEAQRQELASALERYRQAHGQYPTTLAAAGLKAPRTPYGPLHYSSSRSPRGVAGYLLAYGNNEINGFEALWSTEAGAWEIFRF